MSFVFPCEDFIVVLRGIKVAGNAHLREAHKVSTCVRSLSNEACSTGQVEGDLCLFADHLD